MKSVRTHSFNGRRYKIYVREAPDGMCDRKPKEMGLYIFTNLRTCNGLITALHEALHAENHAATEESIDRISTEVGTFLWRLGYRWKPNGR